MKFIPHNINFETKADFEKYEQETLKCIDYFKKYNGETIAKGLELVHKAFLQYKAEQYKKYPELFCITGGKQTP